MHILVFSQHFYPETNAPASRLHGHCKIWTDGGHQVTVISSIPVLNTEKKRKYNNKFIQMEAIGSVRVIRVWTWRWKPYSKVNRIMRYLIFPCLAIMALRRVGRVDIILSTTPDLFCGFVGFIAKKILKKPWVLEVRDIWPASIASLGGIKFNLAISMLEYLEKIMYRNADGIVAVSRSVSTHVESIRARKDVQVLENGVDNFFLKDGKTDSEIFNVTQGRKFIISYCGSLGFAQKLETVLACARKFRDDDEIRFILMGEGAEREKLEKYVVDNQLLNTCILRAMDKSAVRELYRMSNIAIVCLGKSPVLETALPSKMVEAMACGCPILLSGAGESANLIYAAQCGDVVPPEEPTAMYHAINRMKNSPSELWVAGANGRVYVKKNLLRERIAKKYLSYLCSLAQF